MALVEAIDEAGKPVRVRASGRDELLTADPDARALLASIDLSLRRLVVGVGLLSSPAVNLEGLVPR